MRDELLLASHAELGEALPLVMPTISVAVAVGTAKKLGICGRLTTAEARSPLTDGVRSRSGPPSVRLAVVKHLGMANAVAVALLFPRGGTG